MKINRFAENLKKLRKLYNLNQEDISKKFGYKSRASVQQWESGRTEPPLDVVIRLADMFRVDVGTLIGADLQDRNVIVENKCAELFRRMSPEGQEKSIELMEYFAFKYPKKDISELDHAKQDKEEIYL